MEVGDGQANVGLRDPAELARHTGALQERGILTSAVGIGDDYDEALLAGMVEAGGGRLHDAADAQEISEVVLGELLEGRRALVERAMLRVQLGAVERAEDSLTERIPFSAQVTAQLPDGSGEISADAPEITLTFAEARQNTAQRRNAEVSLAALTAWQSETMRRAIQLNRAHDRRRARHYLSKELRFIEAYARGLAGAEPLMIELALLSEQIEEEMDERVRKDVFMASMKRERGEGELRSLSRGTVGEMLRRPKR